MHKLNLKYNLNFTDLYDPSKLKILDEHFLSFLDKHNAELYKALQAARLVELEDRQQSELILELSPYLDDFIGGLFNITTEINNLNQQHNELAVIYFCKRNFVQRKALKLGKEIDQTSILQYLPDNFSELIFAQNITKWLEDEEDNAQKLITAANYTKWAMETPEGRQYHHDGILFKKPKKLDYNNLVDVIIKNHNDIDTIYAQDTNLRNRYGFKLTEEAPSLEHTLDQANYCIHCHHQEKDSCSKGLRDKEGKFKISPTNIKQEGCPLEEKISEMHEAKTKGIIVGALAIIVIDNPLAAATGNRICNDCMKSCIFQKQDPVNIPLAESGILNDVLNLPWGFEIYSLLTRWNPLNFKNYLACEINDNKIMIAGMGPAGFTAAHYLLNQGFTICAIDGLKIEPLPQDIAGIDVNGQRHKFKPIFNVRAEIFEELDERVMYGFGGVAEYGITVRWDKNYLKIIRLLLERRANFRLYGGVRIGQGYDFAEIFGDDFDHVVLATGAGKPNILPIKNILSRGVRTASDFLMSLQLTGAAKMTSIANMQVRLPILVIGGGLTAIDTATESMAYYIVQVEKFAKRFSILCDKYSEEKVRLEWDAEEKIIAEEYLLHAKLIAECKRQNGNLSKLINDLGGVKILYRKRLQDSPAYRLNHEEVEKALEEGIGFIENMNPEEIIIDEFEHVKAIKVQDQNGNYKIINAKSIFIATGTNPNITLSKECNNGLEINGKYFQAIDENGQVRDVIKSVKNNEDFILTSFYDHRAISFIGDLHPSFAGNVVKAMASAKKASPIISNLVNNNQASTKLNYNDFFAKMDNKLLVKIHEVTRLTPTIIEVILRAPMQARNFSPGQFYRLQNFEVNAKFINDTKFTMEGLALTGAWVDKEKGLISVIVLEMGGSSDLCQYLVKDEPVILMGPTGTPTAIPKNKNIMLVGGGLGNAVLFSIGKALRANNCKVVYFAGYKKAEDRYKVEEIEAASDIIIWCCDEKQLPKTREYDFTFHGNMLEAIESYNNLDDNNKIALADIEHLITIGSDRLMSVIKDNLETKFKSYFPNLKEKIGSINSTMQCMMKEICAQCLQKHIDPKTGEEYYVYSCYNQDQNLDFVDFNHLSQRLKQNSLQEKLTKYWLRYNLTG